MHVPTEAPLIGITSSVNALDYEYSPCNAVVMLPLNYAACVRAAGGQPLLLPEGEPLQAAAAMARLDGLIVAGGRDIDPALYGETAHSKTNDIRASQDRWELALIRAALSCGKPLLGICRGHQLLCVHFGGRLHQHLPDVEGLRESSIIGRWSEHLVEVAANTRLASILGAGDHRVQVANHQAGEEKEQSSRSRPRLAEQCHSTQSRPFRFALAPKLAHSPSSRTCAVIEPEPLCGSRACRSR